MEKLFDIATVILALILTVQDFKSRSISVLILVSLGLALILPAFIYRPLKETGMFFLMNSVIIVSQLIVLSIYFSAKNKKLISIFDTYIGWGDILLFVILAPVFSPVNYVLLFTGTMMLGLLGFVIYKIISPGSKLIPLAGIMSLALCLMIAIKYTNGFNFYDESWMLKLMR